MNANKIKKIKVLKNKYILFINGNEYPIDSYFYECLLPYNNKVLEVKDMLNVIAFSSCNEVISKLYKRIFAHELSTYEVKAKLKCKEINEEHINLVISFLKSEGHLKEEDFINHYKEIYQYKKGYKAFKRFLESKHISDYSINKAMLSYNENEEYVYEYANKFIKSKTNSNKMIKAKLIASLTNKGFSSEVINKVIDKLEFDDDIINLKKEIVKYVKKYPDDKYKVISKLASKGYNVNMIKKVMEEGMYFEN